MALLTNRNLVISLVRVQEMIAQNVILWLAEYFCLKDTGSQKQSLPGILSCLSVFSPPLKWVIEVRTLLQSNTFNLGKSFLLGKSTRSHFSILRRMECTWGDHKGCKQTNIIVLYQSSAWDPTQKLCSSSIWHISRNALDLSVWQPWYQNYN